ncbi:hypothetical protein PIB30_040128 [Stylosanthes scabra]|uniref:Uncharacterized protein n=1 Tax=Stylosanthes scabra TaxID=79078 RepID=A0ABU6TFA4_9FABA|nr:hypothetical protein [Stylosanthes scabra]
MEKGSLKCKETEKTEIWSNKPKYRRETQVYAWTITQNQQPSSKYMRGNCMQTQVYAPELDCENQSIYLSFQVFQSIYFDIKPEAPMTSSSIGACFASFHQSIGAGSQVYAPIFAALSSKV